MRRTLTTLAGALLLAGCGAEASGDAVARAPSTAQAMGPGAGGMGGGGMGGGGMMMMDPECASMMGGGGMGGGGMGGGPLAMLGRMIFCDMNLSSPPGQSCATCHSPATGFTGPRSDLNAAGAVYPGAANTATDPRFGNRKPPSAAYATPSPQLQYVAEEDLFVGGLFFDGRATGWRLGDPAAEQALGPFLNPAEQNLADAGTVVRKVCGAMYGNMFRMQFREVADRGCAADATAVEIADAYDAIGRAVSAFEASPMVNRYSSKYDRYLANRATLTQEEARGLALFTGKGKCSACHPAVRDEDGNPPLFTDNTFDNLGLPPNPENPATLRGELDLGLGGFLAGLSKEDVPWHRNPRALANLHEGKHRVPSLRNVDKRPSAGFVKAYGHNGAFKSLKAIVHFYNTRDVLPQCEKGKAKKSEGCWPAPEVPRNVNGDELGNLGLTSEEEDAIVAFLKTLSDA
jgi:cytochrome c peroxidase